MKKILSVLTALVLVFALLMGTACADEAFLNVFHDNGFVTERHNMPEKGLKYARYAIALEEGIVDQHELFHKWGKVRAMYNSALIPAEGKSQIEKEQILAQMYKAYEDVIAEEFVGTDYVIYDSYVVFTLYYFDLDKKENVHKLAEYGIVEAGADYLSFKQCDKVWLEAGYAKED